MKNNDIVVYRGVPVIYQDIAGNKYYGDVPIWSYNSETKSFMAVDNRRGFGYACRHQLRNRKRKKF